MGELALININERKQALCLVTRTVANQRSQLAQASTLESLLAIRAAAAAAVKLAKSARLSIDICNQAAELRIRVEVKAGRALSALKLRGGSRKRRSKNQVASLKLEDLGISQNESTRWQRIGRISDDRLDAYFASCLANQTAATSIGASQFGEKKCTPTSSIDIDGAATDEVVFSELRDVVDILSSLWSRKPVNDSGSLDGKTISLYIEQLSCMVEELKAELTVTNRD